MSFFTTSNLRTVTGGRWLKLVDRDQELRGVGIDSREDLSDRAFIAIKGDTHDGHDFLPAAVKAGAVMLVVQREVDVSVFPEPVSVLHVDDTIRALGRMASAYRRTLTGTKVIGITGTAGKTTTKRLIDAVLARRLKGTAAPKSFNNHIGVPLTILGADPHDKYLVVEIGTNAPGEIVHLASIAEPDLVVITMIGRGHLERFGSIEAIAREKASILQALRPGGLVIAHADSLPLRPFLKSLDKCITFGESSEADIRLTDRGGDGKSWWFEVNGRQRFEIGLPGRHNAINALAAITVGRRFSLADDAIGDGLALVEPDAMRMERLRVGQIDVYNDAYNANPESVIAALETFMELASKAKRRIVVLGDMLELGDEAEALHREVGRQLIALDARRRIHRVIAVGDLAGFIADELAESWPADRMVKSPSVEALKKSTMLDELGKGDAVLLKGSRGMALERLIDSLESKSRTGHVEVKPTRSSRRKKVKA